MARFIPPFIRCGDAEVGRIEERVLIRFGLANLIGACVSFLAGMFTTLGEYLPHQGLVDVRDLIAFALYMGATGPAGAFGGRRRFETAVAGLRTGDSDHDAEPAGDPSSVLRAPWWYALASLAGWLGAAVLFGTLEWSKRHHGLIALRVGLTVVLGGFTTSAVAFLLIERAMRPLVARALADGALPRRAAGIRTRMTAAWALGSAIPLLLVGVLFIGPRARAGNHPALAVWSLVVVGVVAGRLVIMGMARAVSEPLDEVRAALTRVEQEDLDVQVPIDDSGEIGMLQSGVNRMVAGLRERRQLEDLFGRHVGSEVAREALVRGVALGGERREVSVLFVDLIGSTRLAQSQSPERVVALLNTFFDVVVSRVVAEGGWINKFQGDGAMCVFGAPAPQRNHADRALRAARVLRRELLALAAEHPALDAAVGVSSGFVVAGNVGSEQRYEYTVIGDAVNEAARLTEAAKTQLSRVLASEAAVTTSTAERGRWAVADELALRGRSQPTLAYQPAVLADEDAELPA